MKRLCVFIAVCCLFPSALTAQGRLTAAHGDAMRDSVRAFMTAYGQAFEAGRYDQVAEMYSSDARFRWIESGVVTAKSAAQIATYLKQYPAGMKVKTTYTDTEILPLAPALAQLITAFRTEVGDSAAGGFAFGGAMTVILIHESGGWKFLQGHASAPVPRGR
jgi:hypothetical protein